MSGLWIAIAVPVAIAMEPWSRVVHGRVWHGVLYSVHRSHHEPSGFFEANDLFALMHAIPAAAMIVYGLTFDDWTATIALGVGAGMTAFGAAYAVVHDGLIHGRLPVGFLRRFRYFRRIAGAHEMHHRTGAEPYGLFDGPAELARASRVRPRITRRRLEESCPPASGDQLA